MEKEKSYVEEFLEGAKENGEWVRGLGEDTIALSTHDWFSGFCQELEILLEIQKATQEHLEYLKAKNEK